MGGAFLVLVFLILRVGMDAYWRKVSPWWSYGFEALFTLIVLSAYRGRKLFRPPKLGFAFLAGLLGFAGGFAAYRGAGVLRFIVPFDFSGFGPLFQLLVLAPVLEELVYRGALWEPSVDWLGSGRAWGVTTLLFALGHFQAYFFVPAEYQGFVLYQTGYVLVLGAAAGWVRRRLGGIWIPMLLHGGFNFGFFIAGQR